MREHYDFSKIVSKRNPYLKHSDKSENDESEDIELTRIAKEQEDEESIPVDIQQSVIAEGVYL